MSSVVKKVTDFLPLGIFKENDMVHGYTDGVQIQPVAFLKTIGLTQKGRDYQFQGKLGDVLKFMKGDATDLTVKCHDEKKEKPTETLVVDIYDVALTGVEQYQKAIVEQVSGVSLLLKFVEIVGSKKVVIKLRHGVTAPPQTKSHIRIKVNPTTLGDLAESIALGCKEAKVGVLDVVDLALNVTELLSVDIDVNEKHHQSRGNKKIYW
eukprot:CAMPEP_0178895342 /NCGR_PEP_ID=MMETSP0786-20121207/534_1 /TAXON_ID=186022 /ORGANISM="Thalassionema frauenfeldii, Strain CCMP 1798" /LENGTH=207 /DNA_ID=CAMNT_0020565563 /DNA_START=33 /DNA_END=653 /DNA_ORIENTATION=+